LADGYSEVPIATQVLCHQQGGFCWSNSCYPATCRWYHLYFKLIL